MDFFLKYLTVLKGLLSTSSVYLCILAVAFLSVDIMLHFLTVIMLFIMWYRGAYIRWLNSIPQWALVVALLMLYISRCIISSAAFSPFYVCMFILLFLRIKWWSWIERSMMFLGKFSTSVWLIHTWFCYYLFHDFIYGFHYPMLILVVEFAVSIMSGYVIQKIAAITYRMLHL